MVPPNTFATAVANCEAGEKATGGGFVMFGSGARDLRLSSSGSNGGTGWQVTMVNEDTVTEQTFFAVAECMQPLP